MEKKETITIEKDTLDKIMQRMERLEASADKARLENFDSKQKKKIGKIVRLRAIDGKIIVGWRTLKDVVEKTPRGVWKEDQQIEVTYEDETTEKFEYVIFIRRYESLLMDVKKEVENEDGSVTFIGETSDGKKHEIKDTFVN